MTRQLYKKWKNGKILRGAKCSMIFLICLIIVFSLSFTIYASTYNENKVLKVGFFEFEGYHESDAQNQRSGYGYEYLHEMAKYTGWTFEYVDGTWDECQEMLKNGKIDILTSAQYSEERDEIFDFSSNSMGTSYAQISVTRGNSKYGRNDFKSFEGIKIGLIKGNSRNDRLAEFAKEKGFTYSSILYDTQDELDIALKTGAVDAVLTSSLRKLENESIIAQFAPSPFYAIVKEGNSELLKEINLALESIEMSTPAFRYNLYQEYYDADTANTFVLSPEEKEYLKNRPVIRAIIRPGAAPISYWEDNTFKGISADIMEYLLGDLNIQVEYIYPASRKESYQMIANGSADIACLFESDYNLAEQYNARITTPYIKVNYSIISKRTFDRSQQSVLTIALPEGGLMGTRYAQAHYPNATLITVASDDAAVEAVTDGQANIAIINIYAAESSLIRTSNLRADFISDDEQQFSVAVSQSMDSRLYSIIDKKISAMNTQVFNDILSKHTIFNHVPMNMADYFRQHPLQIMLISVIVFLVIIGVLIYIMFTNKKHAKRIYGLAYIDDLTKLWNANGFLLHGNKLLEKHSDDIFAVISLDVARFSNVNESYGRDIGDKVIQNIGSILNRFSNESTVIAHFDADRFLMLLQYKDQDNINTTLTAIAGMLDTCTIGELVLRFNIYMGVSLVKRQGDDLLQAIDHAHIARNRCDSEHAIVYMDETLQRSLLQEKDIRDHVEFAIENGEFQVYYQPKVDMTSNSIFGAEALVRWNHRKLGFLNPNDFIPILEQSGIITEVDFYVLEVVCKLIKQWIDDGKKPIIVSVNQSRANFVKTNYIERLQSLIIKYNIPPGSIELEITETLFGQEVVSEMLIKRMRSIGFLISIDDFGSGYSSLYLLHQISIDILKIDKGLLDEGLKYEKVKNIIRRIVQIASDIDVEIICEGVETKEQVELLLEIGCKYAQGYLFSRPLPENEFQEFLQKNNFFVVTNE